MFHLYNQSVLYEITINIFELGYIYLSKVIYLCLILNTILSVLLSFYVPHSEIKLGLLNA